MNRHALLCLALPLAFAPLQDPRDYSKRKVELALEQALPIVPELAAASPQGVAPGLVRWHADFATACAAAKRSRKPVLLFQLLGRLDEEFC